MKLNFHENEDKKYLLLPRWMSFCHSHREVCVCDHDLFLCKNRCMIRTYDIFLLPLGTLKPPSNIYVYVHIFCPFFSLSFSSLSFLILLQLCVCVWFWFRCRLYYKRVHNSSKMKKRTKTMFCVLTFFYITCMCFLSPTHDNADDLSFFVSQINLFFSPSLTHTFNCF